MRTMPRLRISDIVVEPLGQDLFKVWVTIENQRLIPTRTAWDVEHHISPPDVASIRGEHIQAISAGRITDRFFRKVDAVESRPERVELDSIGGMEAARVQFIVKGTGDFTITIDSAKGGLLRKDGSLPGK